MTQSTNDNIWFKCTHERREHSPSELTLSPVQQQADYCYEMVYFTMKCYTYTAVWFRTEG